MARRVINGWGERNQADARHSVLCQSNSQRSNRQCISIARGPRRSRTFHEWFIWTDYVSASLLTGLPLASTLISSSLPPLVMCLIEDGTALDHLSTSVSFPPVAAF